MYVSLPITVTASSKVPDERGVRTNERKMSHCIDLPPVTLPSLSIESSAIDPNFVAAAPYEPIAGARRTGSGSLWWHPLIGAFNGTQRKIEIWTEHRSWVAAIR
jgi:hypothetical protein